MSWLVVHQESDGIPFRVHSELELHQCLNAGCDLIQEEYDMLKTLRFVQGAVAKKDFVPALTHFRISKGRIMGFNGRIALSSPIACDLDATPEALPFIRAIDTCEEEVSLTLTEAGRLTVRSGSFKAHIKCTTDAFPVIQPEGKMYACGGGVLSALTSLLPFVSEDASRPWSQGVLLRGHSAFATNNVILAQKWLGYEVPIPINIPRATVQEIVRIGEPPTHMQVSESHATFFFEGDRFLHSLLYSLEWPDVETLLDRPWQGGAKLQPVPDTLFKRVSELMPFADKLGRMYFGEEGICTVPPEVKDDGASADLPMPGVNGIYAGSQLLKLEGIATDVDFAYGSNGNPAPWMGDAIRGLIVGMRR